MHRPAHYLQEDSPASTHLLTAAHSDRAHGRHFVLFQPFSDMRILSTLTLFPGFDLYVLLSHARSSCAAVAKVPALESLPFALRGLCSCVNLAPVLMIGLQCLGFEVRSAATAYPNGRPAYAGDRTPAHALRVDFGRPGQATQHIFHASLDASDEGLDARPDFLEFMDALPNVVTLMRGASGAFGEGGFRALESLITSKSTAIVEDDLCLPYASLRKAGYYVRLQKSWVRASVELCEHLPVLPPPGAIA
jgi:hypothetical protein